MKDLKDGLRALVRLDFNGRVHKTYRGSGIQERYEQEVAVLKVLEERECPYVPRLLEEHPEEFRIVTTSCGAPALHLTKKKATSLFEALERDYGVVHDDPEPRNVTYSAVLGRFCLIDFELATILPMTEEATKYVPSKDAVWKIRWTAQSQQGTKHDGNDDSYTILGLAPEEAHLRADTSEELLDPEHTLLAVSDGMGGRKAGEFASQLILAWLRGHAHAIYDHFSKDPDDPEPLAEVLKEVHLGLNKIALEDDLTKGMGATLTAAYIMPGHLTVAHLGDSRLYLQRDGETQLITRDHSRAFDQWQAGELNEYRYRQHPRRAALYDSLGGGHTNINPQLLNVPLQHGDRLLICSDGIIDGLWEKNIAQELAADSFDDIADSLMKRAVENDGRDDCTFIVAEISQL